MSDNSVINVTLSTGAILPLRATTAKSGNAYHAILEPGSKFATKYGVNVAESVVGGKLPTSVEVLGTSIKLTTGTTQSGNPKVEAVNVAVEMDGEKREFSLRISKTARGFNVSGRINRLGNRATARPVATTL